MCVCGGRPFPLVFSAPPSSGGENIRLSSPPLSVVCYYLYLRHCVHDLRISKPALRAEAGLSAVYVYVCLCAIIRICASSFFLWGGGSDLHNHHLTVSAGFCIQERMNNTTALQKWCDVMRFSERHRLKLIERFWSLLLLFLCRVANVERFQLILFI